MMTSTDLHAVLALLPRGAWGYDGCELAVIGDDGTCYPVGVTTDPRFALAICAVMNHYNQQFVEPDSTWSIQCRTSPASRRRR